MAEDGSSAERRELRCKFQDFGSLIIEQYDENKLRADHFVYEFSTSVDFVTESLILAQNERWRHGLGMQVERSLR